MAFRQTAVICIKYGSVLVDKGSGVEPVALSLPVHESFLYQSCGDRSKAAAGNRVGHSVLHFHRFYTFCPECCVSVWHAICCCILLVLVAGLVVHVRIFWRTGLDLISSKQELTGSVK